MASLFTKIIRGEILSHKIAEDANFFAFLDIFPLVKGHTLVVPKEEIDYLFDLDDTLLSQLYVFSKPIAYALKKAIPCQRIGTAVVGLEVPHAHLHLIPLNHIDDINFSRQKLKPSPATLAQIATEIRKHLP